MKDRSARRFARLAAPGLAAFCVPLFVATLATPAAGGIAAAEIAALTAPQLAGRGAGTPQEREAAGLVADWLAAAGLEPAFAGSWLQPVSLPGGESANVCGQVPGCGELQDRWILVGAHLDHLGRVDPAATGVPAPGEYYPGAGDNAAGVAALLHVARTADAGGDGAGRRSLLVCAFGAEEIGLFGSAHLAANLPVPADRLDAMVNLDAVGRLGTGPVHVAGLDSSPGFAGLVAAAAGDLAIQPQAALISSDHASFLARGVPSLFFFTSPYAEMNSPADSLAAVDLPGLARVAALAARVTDALRRHPGPLPFTAAADPDERVADTADGDRRTWFGTVPDFDGGRSDGYPIGGLAEDGPAARAGLLPGDVLVALAGETVGDLATFTAALRRHPPGAVVEVVVLREGRRLSFLVTLGDRQQRLR